MFLQHLQATQDFRTHNEIVIRLVLRDVADADEFRMILKFQQLLLACFTGEIHPTDHANQPIVFLSHAEHPAIFLQVMLCLHKDALGDAGCIQVRPQIGRQISTVNRRMLRRLEPLVIERLV